MPKNLFISQYMTQMCYLTVKNGELDVLFELLPGLVEALYLWLECIHVSDIVAVPGGLLLDVLFQAALALHDGPQP